MAWGQMNKFIHLLTDYMDYLFYLIRCIGAKPQASRALVKFMIARTLGFCASTAKNLSCATARRNNSIWEREMVRFHDRSAREQGGGEVAAVAPVRTPEQSETVEKPQEKLASPDSEIHIDRIKTILSSNLPGKISRLYDLLLGPISFQELDASQSQAGVELFAEMEDIVDQLATSVRSFWGSEELFVTGGTSDIEHYRCGRTLAQFVDLLIDLGVIFEAYGELVPIPELIPTSGDRLKYTWELLVKLTHDIRYPDLKKWFERSDLTLECAEHPTLNPDTHSEPLKAFIPIIKLSRLFFDKLSRPTSDEPHPITQMSSYQLIKLANATLPLPDKLTAFYDNMEWYEPKLTSTFA
ncbi:hypothetical protein KEM48_006222 [Puccinia striiformis f. sp. tritici PST-130]|nr:hypothetical protein KEM48_006222 [Puccinia striiformis f. sp. tritici PST-130]